MDVRLPDGTVIRGVPDGMSKADLTAKLAANGYDVSKLAGSDASRIPGSAPDPVAGSEPEPSFAEKLSGGVESARSMVGTMVGGTIGKIGGTLGGIAGSIATGEFGTDIGTRRARDVSNLAAERLSVAPRTKLAQEYTSKVGKAISDTGIEGLPIGPEMAVMANSLRTSGAMRNMAQVNDAALAAQEAKMTAGAVPITQLLKRQKAKTKMAGGGAAEANLARLRAQRAAELPVPINLTKGQRERTFEQQRFEQEAAKDPTSGARLREHFAEQNQRVPQNFDAWIDDLGAAQADLRGVGKVVTDAVVNKATRAKAVIRDAYDKARAAGEMAEKVDVAKLRAYLAENEPAGMNAPIIGAIDSKLRTLDPKGTGLASLNDLEELRKFSGALAQKDPTNAHFGGQIRTIIDDATRNASGPQYQQARRMFENYSKEFKDKGAVARLIGTKRGSSDQKVAFEDVFNKSILNGSLDDVRALRRTLQTDGGGEGAQAWRELQGATLNHMKETALSNAARDIRGNPIVSAEKLDRVIKSLDADGKLDFIFGKQGAAKLRDINDLAKDIYTAPPGSVNTSNTASVVLAAMDTIISGSAGVPLPLLSAARYGTKRLKDRQKNKQIDEALAPLPDE